MPVVVGSLTSAGGGGFRFVDAQELKKGLQLKKNMDKFEMSIAQESQDQIEPLKRSYSSGHVISSLDRMASLSLGNVPLAIRRVHSLT